ncbi:MAG: hypothetical protein ACREME_12235, partial [Gemmatimonadales bacterium]
MRELRAFVALLAGIGSAACEPAVEPLAPSLQVELTAGGSVVVTGGGQFVHPTLGVATFSVS